MCFKIKDKIYTINELKVLFSNGIRLFPIQQGGASYADYFNDDNAEIEANRAVNAANNFKLQFGAIIYFAVDYDAQDAEIDNIIIPYFEKVYETVMSEGKGRYRRLTRSSSAGRRPRWSGKTVRSSI